MSGTDVLTAGAATAIGSLPHSDAREASQLVRSRCPELPAAPELVALGPEATLLGRFARSVPGLAHDGERLFVDGVLDAEAELDVGVDPVADAGLLALTGQELGDPGALKVGTIGPVTALLALVAAGVPVERARRLAVRQARARAEALVAHVRSTVPGVRPFVTFDEPGLVAVGAGGFDVPLTMSESVDMLSAAASAIDDDAITGVHVCGPADWSAVFQAGLDVVFAPLGAGLERLPGAVDAFLDRGGWIGWGVVPTDEPIGSTGERRWRILSDRWCSLVTSGCDPLRLRTQALVSPACGLAGFGESQAVRALDVTAQVASRLHEQVVAVRFAVGA